MTSDIQKLIDDSALSIHAPPENLILDSAAVRLTQSDLWKAARKISPKNRLKQRDARKLAILIRLMRIYLTILRVFRTPLDMR
jgi:hypothetical protein